MAPSKKPRGYSSTMASTCRVMNRRKPSWPLFAVRTSYPFFLSKLSGDGSRWMQSNVVVVAILDMVYHPRLDRLCSKLLKIKKTEGLSPWLKPSLRAVFEPALPQRLETENCYRERRKDAVP